MIREVQHFGDTGGSGHSLLDDNQVFEKTMETYGGDYARGQREYSAGRHCIRFRLEAVNPRMTADTILIGIISSKVTATDQYFDRTPSTYAWGTTTFPEKNETTIVENGIHRRVPKDKWTGAKLEDILELTIDCDQQTISMENQTNEGKDSMKVNVANSPLPWKFIVILSTQPNRVRLL